jgi:hypothetical protein
MTGVLKGAPRAALVLGICTTLLACGDSGSGSADTAVTADGGVVCGTQANPGVLKLTGLSPAIGSTVVNQGIVHAFLVMKAPAVFTNFTLNDGASHTAGRSTPADLEFKVTLSGSDLVYQLTVDAWSHAPGHVELEASGGYATLEGCSWVFPSPLFSYDIAPMLDGGTGETTVDGVGPHDGTSALDAPDEMDVPLALEASASAEAPGALDVVPALDAGMD